MSGKEYKKEHQTELDEINKTINNNDLIDKIIDRFILKGAYSYMPIDVIVYGEIDNFI